MAFEQLSEAIFIFYKGFFQLLVLGDVDTHTDQKGVVADSDFSGCNNKPAVLRPSPKQYPTLKSRFAAFVPYGSLQCLVRLLPVCRMNKFQAADLHALALLITDNLTSQIVITSDYQPGLVNQIEDSGNTVD